MDCEQLGAQSLAMMESQMQSAAAAAAAAARGSRKRAHVADYDEQMLDDSDSDGAPCDGPGLGQQAASAARAYALATGVEDCSRTRQAGLHGWMLGASPMNGSGAGMAADGSAHGGDRHRHKRSRMTWPVAGGRLGRGHNNMTSGWG